MPEQEHLPLNEVVINKAIKQFWSRQSFYEGSYREPNTTFKAAEEALTYISKRRKRLGISTLDLGLQLIKGTQLPPSIVDFHELKDSKSWEEIFEIISRDIIAGEMERRDPKITPEERRRLDRFQ